MIPRSARFWRSSYLHTRTYVQTFLKFTHRHCFSIRQRGSAATDVACTAAPYTTAVRTKTINVRMLLLQEDNTIRADILRAGLQRNANDGAMFPVVEATLRPSAVESTRRIGQCSFSVRLAVHKHPLISGTAKDKGAAAIREAVRKLSIILTTGPNFPRMASRSKSRPPGVVTVSAGARSCRRGSVNTGPSTLVTSNATTARADRVARCFMTWLTVRM